MRILLDRPTGCADSGLGAENTVPRIHGVGFFEISSIKKSILP